MRISHFMAYSLTGLVLFLVAVLPVHAAVEIGKPAPDFEAVDIDGDTVRLSDLKGKKVVLEWTNHLCPYVQKHYGSGNMQATQEAARAQGAEWISIVSSAPGLQGHTDAAEAHAILEETGASPSVKILDESGEIGRLYGARTTPHMFVVNESGTLVYAGAIDNKPSPNPATIDGAENYVLEALADIEAGHDVRTPLTEPYGCAVKYAH
ncbi:MAG: redoxin domain-containing protein [Alphaproteobacteria bacterium]